MKILKLLNKKIFFIFLISFSSFITHAEEKPIDIWNVDKQEVEVNSIIKDTKKNKDNEIKIQNESEIFNMQSQNSSNIIELDEISQTNDIKIYGLYDPEDFSLDINMWINSDGDQLKRILLKLNKMNLSEDSKELMTTILLTNAHLPKKIFQRANF